VGCGQGTQLLHLARRGHFVTGLDVSSTLLEDAERTLTAESSDVRQRVRLVHGDAERALDLAAPASFDAVLCHGVLMYFSDPNPLLHTLASVVAPGGMVSLLVRNGDALAMRPGLRGDWAAAREAFDGTAYRNRIGVTARADRLDDLTASLAGHHVSVLTWYGVRVFTDIAADDAPVPEPEQLSMLLACEERAGCTDPYRQVAALIHVIAERSSLG
jgi:S-adenosylmethionine-dependent methyltransferase